MRVLFRCDASDTIGTGHIVRCLALAGGLRSRDTEVFFVCADLPGNMAPTISRHGFNIGLIHPCSAARDDAQATMAAVFGAQPFDWLVVDSYRLDHRFERLLCQSVRHVLVIDDLHDRRHLCDLLVDTIATEGAIGRYAGLIQPGTVCLLGQRYVPLRQTFLGAAPADRDFTRVQRVLVSYGGTDPLDMTSRALSVVADAAVRHIHFDVVIGRTNPRRRRLKVATKHLPNVRVHIDTPHMPMLMACSDLSLGAGGTTTWERMFMGLPSIVVALADNQLEICESLSSKGLIRYLGFGTTVTAADLHEALLASMEGHSWRARVSALGRRLVDGRGVERIIDAMKRIEESQ